MSMRRPTGSAGSSAPSVDPVAWAKRMQAAKERAAAIRAARSGTGGMDDYQPPTVRAAPPPSSSGGARPPADSFGGSGGGYDGYGMPSASTSAGDVGYTDAYAPSGAGGYGGGGYAVGGGGDRGYGGGDAARSRVGMSSSAARGADPYGGAPSMGVDPYGASGVARSTVGGGYGMGSGGGGAPAVGGTRPGYRGMVSYDSGAPPDAYGPGPTTGSAGSGAYGMSTATPTARAAATQEVDDLFYGSLRGSDDAYGGSAPGRAGGSVSGRAGMAGTRRTGARPEWNSDVTPLGGEAAFDDGGAPAASSGPASSSAARAARMRNELRGNPQTDPKYAGITPAAPAPAPVSEYMRASGGGSSAGGSSFDDMPIRAPGGRSAGGTSGFSAPPPSSFDDMPVGGRGGGGGGGSNAWDAAGAYPPSDDGVDASDASRPRAVATPSAAKLSLLKNKIRTGSARVTRSGSMGAPTPTSTDASEAGGYFDDAPASTYSAHRTTSTRSGGGFGGSDAYDTAYDAPPARPTARPAARPPPPPASAVAADDGGYTNPSRAPRSDADDGGWPSEQPEEEVELIMCDGCGRKFAEAALAKHAKVCAKVFQTKRAAFDSKAQALPGEALALASKTARQQRGKPASSAAGGDRPIAGSGGGKKPGWENKSNQLREAMRAAREYANAVAAGKSGADLPPPPVSQPDPSLVPCPHCGRSFNETAAERHIPKCSSIKAKPTVLRKGTGKAAVSTAVKDNSSAAGMFAPPRAAPAGPPGGGMGGGGSMGAYPGGGPVRGPAMPPPGGRMGGGPAAGGMASYDGGYDQYDAGLPVQRRGSSGPMGAPVSRYAQQPAASVGGGGYSGGGGGMPAPSRGARPTGGYSAAGYDAPADSYGYGRDYGTGGFPSSLPVSGRASMGGGGYAAAPSSGSAYPGRGGPGGQSAYATYTSRDGSGPAPPGARAGSASRYAGSAPGYR